MRLIAIHFEPKDVLTGCQIYRINVPFYYLGKHGWDIRVEKWEFIQEEFLKYGRGTFVKLAMDYDVFVFPRLTLDPGQSSRGLASLFKLIRVMGKRIIYEVDDDFTNLHRDLHHLGVHGMSEVASWCDANTVTTPFLAKLMTSVTKRRSYILPNMLGPEIWERPDRFIPHEGVTIGLSGSPTHEADWKILETVLPEIAKKDYGFKVQFLITGYHPEYLRELPNSEMIPGLPYDDYAQIVRHSDIVLAPVDPDDRFNDYKSPIKVIEGMGASRPVDDTIGGAACIATDNQVYRLSIKHNKNGLLCTQTPKSWYDAIDSVLSDPSLRSRLSVAGHAWAWKRHDIRKTWHEWSRAYYDVVGKPGNRKVLPTSSGT